uniref:Uncharacterized protein n=1 Tax=Anguilla anguilla TaxID=7936 RepID=A0A0E9XFN9_ANGAN
MQGSVLFFSDREEERSNSVSAYELKKKHIIRNGPKKSIKKTLTKRLGPSLPPPRVFVHCLIE